MIGPKLAGSRDTAELRHHLMTSAEFQQKNRDYAHTNDRTIVITEIDDGAPAVRRSLGSRHRAEHRARAVRGGRYRSSCGASFGPGDTAVDAGAHIGLFAMHMAAVVGPAGQVYAFEPLDANADLLERSIAENRFTDRLIVQRAAVGQRTGAATLTFAVETLNSGGAYLLRDDTAPLAGNVTRQVPLVALDDVTFARPVRLIKMDVEGAEPQVVEGATRLLERGSPDRPVRASPRPARTCVANDCRRPPRTDARARVPGASARERCARRHRRAGAGRHARVGRVHAALGMRR